MQKTPYVFPIIGARKVEHMMANLEALDIALTDEHIKYLESILPFNLGFPYNIFVSNVSDGIFPFVVMYMLPLLSYFSQILSDDTTLIDLELLRDIGQWGGQQHPVQFCRQL